MSNATLGPWTLEAGRCIVTTDGRFTLTKCGDWNPKRICEMDANARLVAAAPALLAQLAAISDALRAGNRVTIEPVSEQAAYIHAAVANARGDCGPVGRPRQD